MNQHRPSLGFVGVCLFCGLIAALLVGPAAAGDDGKDAAPPQPSIGDRTLGEEEQIRLRQEWFMSTRRAGTQSDAEMGPLRLAAVRQTQLGRSAQRTRRASGYEGGQNVWVSRGPSPSNFGTWAFGKVSGRIQAIAADWTGGSLYVGAASGGVWKSINDGLSWTSIFDTAGTLAVGAIAIDPNNPDILWVGTGDNISGCESYFGIGLLRSDDGGLTWEVRNGSGANTLDDLSSFGGINIDPRDSDRMVVGGRWRGCTSGTQFDGGMYTSDDGGLTWTNRLFTTEIHEIARDPVVLDTLWAGSDDGVYKSVDNGQAWTLQTFPGLPSGFVGRAEIAIAPSAPDTVYALFSNARQIWRTTDGGASWNLMASGSDACDGQCSYNLVIRVDPTDPDIVYRGTVRIFKSLNGGANWFALTSGWGSAQQVHQDTHVLLMHPTEADTFYVSGDGGIWKSENGGTTFTNRNGNLNITQFYDVGVDANDPEKICGGAQDNSSLARDGNDVWERQAVTGDGFVCAINPNEPNYAYITSYPSGGFPNIWRSSTGLFGGFTDITGSGSGINGGDRVSWVTPYMLDPIAPDTLYLGTHRVYRSDDKGNSWIQVGPTDLTGGAGSLISLEVNRTFPSVVYSGSDNGRVFRSDNGGTDFTDITSGLPSRSINDIAADPTNPDRAFVVVGGFNASHLWEWNNGTGWTERGGGLPNVPTNAVLMFSATDILVGSDTGVFRSFDGGQNFVPFMDGLPDGLVVTDLEYVDTVVTAGTYGRGAWQVTTDPLAPILLLDSVEQPLLEIGGDGDGKIEPGETWGLRPILRNAGGQTATGVSAKLSTATGGVTILDPDTGSFGDLPSGGAGPVLTAFQFLVDDSFTCGEQVVFDLTDVTSTNDPINHSDKTAFYSALVLEGNAPSVIEPIVEEGFDPAPVGWSHEPVDFAACPGLQFQDEWNITTKDGRVAYHCGNGPGGTYSQGNHAWLYPSGKDSEGGPGIWIPDDAIGARLTLVHWHHMINLSDGGQVAIDAVDDGLDNYTTLEPDGDYPSGPLATGNCNGLEGRDAFQGQSFGWITSTFDLTEYAGDVVHLAFVFGSDRLLAAGEGWYLDEITIDYERLGDATCNFNTWPGVVDAAHFSLVGPGSVEATWGGTCNSLEFPGQTYSIQVGDLDALYTSGSYTHAPLGCNQASGTVFPAGTGNEYYLIVPGGGGFEGGAGADSAGAARPQTSSLCGDRRVACP